VYFGRKGLILHVWDKRGPQIKLAEIFEISIAYTPVLRLVSTNFPKSRFENRKIISNLTVLLSLLVHLVYLES